ncbi:peptidase MA family metallohydrolase [Horticoccus sp. 23ND18S-11]|uniref:peptidase MA family metallohydrolase n=1 Tax=Horticoccus sp. 23ND18S-11 TaxID=3391832 RepID=UPI0039C97A78
MTGFRNAFPSSAGPGHWRHLFFPVAVFGAALLAFPVVAVRAAEPAEVQRGLLAGNYAAVIKQAQGELRDAPATSEWSMLLVRALLALGRNAEADTAMKEALGRDARSIRLRWLARDVAFANGRPEEAAKRVEEIRALVQNNQYQYRAPADLVVFGRAALMLGADPKDVLEKVFTTAQKADPKLRDVYLARGEVALEKHDFALAAKVYEEGLKQIPNDPDLLFGRAKAYAGGDREIALKSLQGALAQNARHVPTLLQLADHHIDAEAYDDAARLLDDVIDVNPVQPDAWAYRAVIAHLKNDPIAERLARERALASWATNPRVDFLIGEKLSAKYRFAEGAAYQRRAREFDPDYLPAMAQLANDLLRLGDETEGWKLAQAVHERDEYDVEAFNLVTLRETMNKYAALTNDDFVIRMAAPEVAVYGPRVLALLRRAKATLATKYGVELANPTYIEIFADQRDFAVRTFGLPDVPGFLGVCFGRVVTANSPATSSSPTNWESVLWHEFCHVVTLQMTKNKMPRWLSEGISVHEERQANLAWGMGIDPRYREMIMGPDLVPVGKLSGAFLAPKSPRHLQFAYLQSSLVVEYIVGKYGLDRLRAVLTALRDGVEINTALGQHVAPLETLEKEFPVYARERATAMAPKLDWEKPDPELLLPDAAAKLAEWEKAHPDNYWTLRLNAQKLVEQQKWEEARVPLRRLAELYPGQKGAESPYRSLVAAARALNDLPDERAMLTKWAEVDDEATEAYLRLMELAAADKDWPTVARNSDRYLAVNPLVAPPYRYQAQAAAGMGDDSTAVVAWRTLLQLDVPERVDGHYELAKLLHKRGDDGEARRQVLLALEETPRYREALRLLLDLERTRADKVKDPVAPDALVPERKPATR